MVNWPSRHNHIVAMETGEAFVPLIALALLITAALLHTGWNILVKRAREKQVFTWLAMVVGSLCFLPLVLFNAPLPTAVWPYIFASALFETLYYLTLTRAYSIGDFSIVYPLARGAAPAFLAIWSVLFLHEQLHIGGILGLGLLLVGLLMVSSAALRRPPPPTADVSAGGTLVVQRGIVRFASSGVGAALAVAGCISIYSAIDGAAVKIAPAVTYTVAAIGITAIMMTPLMLFRYNRTVIINEWRSNWKQIGMVGIMMLVTYALVLQAYAMSRVGYAGAVREVSIVFAALVGWRWLGEAFGAARICGALLIFAGILLIAIAG